MDIYLHHRPIEHRLPRMSPDGYIRLPLGSLASLPFVHLFSHTDTDFLEDLRDTSIAVSVAGYSEWKSETRPDVTLGWGWFIQSQSEQILLAPDGVPSRRKGHRAWPALLEHFHRGQLRMYGNQHFALRPQSLDNSTPISPFQSAMQFLAEIETPPRRNEFDLSACGSLMHLLCERKKHRR